MTFRDDHDAALARAEALERELEKARDEATDTRAALAKSEAERRRLASEVKELRPFAPKPVDAKREQRPAPAAPAPADAPRPSTRRDSNLAAILVAGFLVLLLVVGLGAVLHSQSAGTESSNCTLQTDPAGADIYIIRSSEDPTNSKRRIESETHLGRSPLTKTRQEWITEGVIGNPVRMEARFASQTIEVRAPLYDTGCSSTIHYFSRH